MQPAHKKILKNVNLRLTLGRSVILDLFLNQPYALSYSKIKKNLSSKLDRVTIYRTIKTFIEKGVIHTILDDTGKLKYALCGKNCSALKHHHQHVHFKCNRCGQTRCLEDVDIPTVQLPQGYRMGAVDFLVRGACANCGG